MAREVAVGGRDTQILPEAEEAEVLHSDADLPDADLPDAAETAAQPGSVGIPAPQDPWGASADLGHAHDPHEVTVQLDAVAGKSGAGFGQARNGGPGTGDGADGPVFVDASGRRSRRFRRIGMAVAVACAVYAVVIVATLISGNSNAPWLPVPGPAKNPPARQVDSSPLPTDQAQPSGAGSASPRASAPASAGTTPSPSAGAQASSASTSPDRPGTPADPKPSPTQTTKEPEPGGPVLTPPPSAHPTPTPGTSPTGGGEPTVDPSPTSSGGGPDPTTGTTAQGPNSPMPVTGEPSTSSTLPEGVL
ncbi:MAG: hypothetical protein LBV60_24935 [Streptomyces sp.]|nr:hypothetical protein [Streptomyces sp.]